MKKMENNQKIKVAILAGGPSEEHEVSLKSGNQVLENIDPKKYEASLVKIDKNINWAMDSKEIKNNFDIVFIALHGKYGEDGTVQSELEAEGILYTGSDAQVSALCMNKHISLKILQDAGLIIPQTLYLDHNDWKKNSDIVLQKAKLFVEPPYVIKPNRSGSSLDMIISGDSDDIEPTLRVLFQKHRDLIIQPFIDGREVTCGVLDHGVSRSAYSLPVTEIKPKLSHFFDYDSKYKVGGSEEITPAEMSDAWLSHIEQTAKKAHILLGCRGFSRVDMVISNEGKVYVLEVNTIPGLTETSLLPQEAEEKKISFTKLIDLIIEAGFKAHKVDISLKSDE
jgi:D-alanine-D-alanine ligase